MENLNFNLSEGEFSKSKKILLWGFSGLFFLAGAGIIFMNLVLHDKSIQIILCLAPFGISIVVGLIAAVATMKREDQYFIIDNEKIEYKFGMVNPVQQTWLWNDIKEIQLPHRQKKVRLVLKNDSSVIINLTWIEKKKTAHIRKHFYYAGKEMNINIVKFNILPAR